MIILGFKFLKHQQISFNLNYNKIEKLEGWGSLSIRNLEKAIKKSKKISLNRFIYSIGIRHIGQENAKIFVGFLSHKKKFSELFNAKKRKCILQNLEDLRWYW